MAARSQKASNTLDKVAMRQPICTHIYTSTLVGTYTHVLSWPRAILFWRKCLWARVVTYTSIHLRLCALFLNLSESSTLCFTFRLFLCSVLYVTSPIYHTSHGKIWFTTCTVSFYDILRIPFVSHTNLQYTHFLSCIHTYMSISWQIACLSLMAARYQTQARTLPMWSIGNGLSWIWRWPEAFTAYSLYTSQNRVHVLYSTVSI